MEYAGAVDAVRNALSTIDRMTECEMTIGQRHAVGSILIPRRVYIAHPSLRVKRRGRRHSVSKENERHRFPPDIGSSHARFLRRVASASTTDVVVACSHLLLSFFFFLVFRAIFTLRPVEPHSYPAETRQQVLLARQI